MATIEPERWDALSDVDHPATKDDLPPAAHRNAPSTKDDLPAAAHRKAPGDEDVQSRPPETYATGTE